MATYHNGFAALIGVIILGTGMLAVSLAVSVAAVGYSDTVYAREMRIRKRLAGDACRETMTLRKSADAFVSRDIYLAEFDCTAVSH